MDDCCEIVTWACLNFPSGIPVLIKFDRSSTFMPNSIFSRKPCDSARVHNQKIGDRREQFTFSVALIIVTLERGSH